MPQTVAPLKPFFVDFGCLTVPCDNSISQFNVPSLTLEGVIPQKRKKKYG